MRNILKSAVLATFVACLAGVPVTAYAGVVLNTKITGISIQSTQFAVVVYAATIASKASCHTGGNGMVIDVSTPKGKALLSLAQSALLADLVVTASGTGGCTNVGSTMENLNQLSVSR